MIRYQKYQSKTKGLTFGMWYVRTVSDETVDLERLAKHMAAHNTPYSAGTVHGVLKDMVACVKVLVLEGKKIKLADLCARPTGNLRSRILTTEARKMQLREYSVEGKAE